MRNQKKAAYLCTVIVLSMTAGCSYSDTDSDVSTVDTINYNEVIDTGGEEGNSDNQNTKENIDNQQDSDEKSDNGESANRQSENPVENGDSQQNNNEDFVQQSNSTQSQAGYTQSQQDHNPSQADKEQLQSDSELDGDIESIADNSVIINKIFHPSANTSVSYTDDSKKVLITVYFSEETEFEVWTVKNGGVNGDADTEKRQGAFSDLKQGASVNMTGSYDGNDFHAKHVIIYNFV